MASKFRDYYELLGVPRTASDEDIKLAYRRLAREHHPDLHPEKEKAHHTTRMQEVNEAYTVLSSKDNRAKYDQFGEHWKDGAPPPPPRQSRPGAESFTGGQEGFSDFFQEMFRQRETHGEARRDAAFQSELDIEAAIELTLEEAVHGVEKSFSLMTNGLCPTCRGTGRTGKDFCAVCGGVGEVRRQREVKTRIPGGLRPESRIRLKGQGNEGPRGRGDLFLTIHLLPEARFRLDGLNLETDVVVMPWQAALGAEVMVPTAHGPVRVKIPKGTHTGARLRLAGKGLGNPGARGDVFARVQIDIPGKLSPEAEALFRKLEEEAHAARP